jgi:hypothetical protein
MSIEFNRRLRPGLLVKRHQSDQDPTHEVPHVGTYTVTLWVQDLLWRHHQHHPNGADHPSTNIVIPNAFTPGSNGGSVVLQPAGVDNNVFYPFVRFVKDFHLRIYKRWGELVFESKDNNIAGTLTIAAR